MTITFNNSTIEIPDTEINKAMKNLDLSAQEAVEMWLDDHGYTSNEEQKKLDKKAKNVKIQHDAQAETEKKARKPREKKKNPIKKAIISILMNALQGELNTMEQMNIITSKISSISVTNDEKYIDFVIDNVKYTVNLVAHREKKEKK